MKIYILIVLSLFSINTYSYDYNKIKKDFIDYSRQYKTVIDLNINNINYPDNISKLNIREAFNDDKKTIKSFSSLNNNNMVINLTSNKVIFSYPKELYPDSLMMKKLVPFLFFFNFNDCSIVKKEDIDSFNTFTKPFIKELNLKYIADIMFIHELAHLISFQYKIPKDVNVFNIWVDNYYEHFQEIHSDLFSIIYANNYLNYSIRDINSFLLFRKANLFLNDDLYHYSNPFINYMIKNEEDWNKLKDFNKINDYIANIYVKISNTEIIGFPLLKKEKKSIQIICKNIIKNYKSKYRSYYSLLLLNKCSNIG